jgi:hypothetical protein
MRVITSAPANPKAAALARAQSLLARSARAAHVDDGMWDATALTIADAFIAHVAASPAVALRGVVDV